MRLYLPLEIYASLCKLLLFFTEVFPPTILGFKNQTVYRQTTVNLNCEITAHPTPKVEWLKNHLSLEDEIKVLPTLESCSKLVQGFYRVNDNKHVGLLVICYPSHARQTGFYTCQAENRKGKSNATAFLNVLGKINFKQLLST